MQLRLESPCYTRIDKASVICPVSDRQTDRQLAAVISWVPSPFVAEIGTTYSININSINLSWIFACTAPRFYERLLRNMDMTLGILFLLRSYYIKTLLDKYVVHDCF